ncbi:MAG: hypothetical protein ACI4JF_08420 [Oscillospiraceae bacterium]
MDKERFYNALCTVLDGEHVRAGIGTYGEKTVHSVLKNYFEPCADGHEQKIGGYVADIVGEDGIIEIQTAGFDKLRRKLDSFLSVCRVTVVHPIPRRRWLISIDPETGARGRRRKSPKTGTPYDIFPELYKIKPMLTNDRLSICIVMLDMEEYRCPPETNGLRRGRRKGYTRYDRIPLSIEEEIHLDNIYDWLYFIPNGLTEEYTSSDFARAAKISAGSARLALNILTEVGAVQRIGKTGNSILYRTAVSVQESSPLPV